MLEGRGLCLQCSGQYSLGNGVSWGNPGPEGLTGQERGIGAQGERPGVGLAVLPFSLTQRAALPDQGLT